MESVYREAAVILKKFEGKQGSLKSIIFNGKKCCSTRKKKLFALVSQTIKYKVPILNAIEQCSVLESSPQLSRHLFMILVYDLVFGKGIQCGGSLKQLMMKKRDMLKSAVAKSDYCSTSKTQKEILPKYARVNLLKVSLRSVIDSLESMNYRMVNREDFLEHFKHCSSQRIMANSEQSNNGLYTSHNVFCQDTLLEYLLVFCPLSSITSTTLYANSQIILQDKASCLPAHLLAPSPGSVVVDCCAAPGNKTTHLASLMGNSGTVHSFDKDKQRFSTLVHRVKEAGATCVKLHCSDFLKINPKHYPAVRYILVDPSCSGSGLVNRLDYHSKVDVGRLKSLSSFQKLILKHALSFPNVERVVYSTCSIHFQENEAVVENVLTCFEDNFKLVDALPDWERRGESIFKEGRKCIRFAAEDLTNGFFVAIFQRKRKSAQIQHTLKKDHTIRRSRCTKSRNRKHCPVTEN